MLGGYYHPNGSPFDDADADADGSRPRIVVADDDRTSRVLLAQTLRKVGYEVHEAEDGHAALQEIREHRPQILLSDWTMPEMDGIELAERVKDDPALQPIYVVILTSRESKDDLVAALDAGADDYLVKPWNRQELLARIGAGLRLVELQTDLAMRNEAIRSFTERINQEMEVVSKMQRSMLPQAVPSHPRLDFTAFYMPSGECGGDYYDVVRIDENHMGFVMADVSGHGAPAMVAMALIRQGFHMIARSYLDPHLLLEELNRQLFDYLPTEQYATMFYAILDTDKMEVLYASAGHNPPYWYRRETGEAETLPGCEGFPLKLVMREATYSSKSVRLAPGDSLICYTDGIPECFNDDREVYGSERFKQLVQENAGILEPRRLETAIVTDVLRFADGHQTEDDLTLLIFRVREADEQPPA